MADTFTEPKAAALALLNAPGPYSRQAGSFLGQVVVDPTPLSEKQRAWLDKLLDRAALPPLVEGVAMDDAVYPDAPGFKGLADTGREAADAMREHCGRLQRMALRAIREAGTTGLTADELAASIGMDRYSVQPRTSELRRKHLIVDSGARRFNRSGKRAIVWTAAREEVAHG